MATDAGPGGDHIRGDRIQRQERRRELNKQAQHWQDVFLREDTSSVFISNTNPRTNERRYGFVPIKSPSTLRDNCDSMKESIPHFQDCSSPERSFRTKVKRKDVNTSTNPTETPITTEARLVPESAEYRSIESADSETDNLEEFVLIDSEDCDGDQGRIPSDSKVLLVLDEIVSS